MPEMNEAELRKSGVEKMKSGGLMALNEVAAVLGITPAAVHKLPLSSIRLGRLLRFDSLDVSKLIGASKEPAVPYEKRAGHMEAVFFGMKFHDETNGKWGYLVNSRPMQRLEWSDVIEALCAGKTVTIEPASPGAIAEAELLLEQFKAKGQSGEIPASEG